MRTKCNVSAFSEIHHLCTAVLGHRSLVERSMSDSHAKSINLIELNRAELSWSGGLSRGVHEQVNPVLELMQSITTEESLLLKPSAV